VGGIPAVMTEEDIERHFAGICRVSKVRIMREKKTQESKGFAFVTLADAASIPQVLAQTHVIEGRKVDVQLASRKSEKKDWKDEQKKKRVFVSNLPGQISNDELAKFFAKYGSVRNAYIIKDFMTDHSKNYGYIEFQEVGVVHTVLKDQVTINGHKVTCLPYVGRHEPKSTNVRGGKAREDHSTDYVYKKKEDSETSRQSLRKANRENNSTLESASNKQNVNPVKSEVIGMSSQLNDHESNYRFKVSGVTSRPPVVRLPGSTRTQAVHDKTEAVTRSSVARYKLLKAQRTFHAKVSLDLQAKVSASETNYYSTASRDCLTAECVRQLHRDLLR
jgi:RNA recognition motif-containing protein